jgi:predicted HicB family RNase H-like nuclease
MLEFLIVIAQAATQPDIISGGAGWVGTGLLSSVLAWIFFSHIPSKDKQIVGLIESRDALVKQLTDTNQEAVKSLALAHQEAVKALSATNQEAVKSLTADFRASVSDMDKRCAEMDRERRHDYNGQLQVVVSHCEGELNLTNQAIRRAIDEHNALMADLRMQIWTRPHRPDKPGTNPPPAPPGTGR